MLRADDPLCPHNWLGMNLKTLSDRSSEDNALTNELTTLYGKLSFPSAPEDRPYILINFATSLDGLTSYNLPGHKYASEITQKNGTDAFIMGLLRAVSDAVAEGPSVYLDGNQEHVINPEAISPKHACLYSALRVKLNLPAVPVHLLITRTGRDFTAQNPPPRLFREPDIRAVVATTHRGAELIKSHFEGQHIPRILVFEDNGDVSLPALLKHLRQVENVNSILIEGGGHFSGNFIQRGLYDELFLTRSPVIMGNEQGNPRPTIAEGFRFSPANAHRLELVSLKQDGDFLFERYKRIPLATD